MRIPETVTTKIVPDGYEATVSTIKMMTDLVDKRHVDKRFRTRMRTLAVNLPSMDYNGEIAAVWNFIIQNVRYIRDPLGAEHITDPLELDREIDEGDGTAMEDCESIALYAATLFASVGIRSAFAILGRNPFYPKKFTHCFLIVQNPSSKQWINFDPVGYWYYNGSFSLGDTAANPGDPLEFWGLDGKRMAMPLMNRNRFENMSSQDFTHGLLGDLLGDTTTADIQSIIGGLVQTGTSIFDMATKKDKQKAAQKAANNAANATAASNATSTPKHDYLMWGLLAVGGILVAKAVL